MTHCYHEGSDDWRRTPLVVELNFGRLKLSGTDLVEYKSSLTS